MFEFHHDERQLFSVSALTFVVLTAMIAVIPAIQAQRDNEPLPTSEPMTEEERRGLQVYVDEGCAYCHTQQVRPVEMDEVWGRPSVAADYARLERPGVWRQTPAVLGSERTGPDLANVGDRQPGEMWHYIHLYDPRAVAPDSVMPSFPWLFQTVSNASDDKPVVSMPGDRGPEEGVLVPTDRGEALVAYLTSLKQAQLPEGRRDERGSGGASGGQAGDGADKKGGSASKGSQRAVQAGGPSGEKIYEQQCASCHQSNGKGLPGTFPPMKGDPVVTNSNPRRHVEIVLNGLEGKTIEGTSYSSKMPAFGDKLNDAEVAVVVNHERTSWGNDAPTVTKQEVAEIRKMLEESQ